MADRLTKREAWDMRWAWRIVGVVLALIGFVWGLQGLGWLRGSPMTGQSFWAVAGLVLLLVGVGVLYVGLRPRQG